MDVLTKVLQLVLYVNEITYYKEVYAIQLFLIVKHKQMILAQLVIVDLFWQEINAINNYQIVKFKAKTNVINA